MDIIDKNSPDFTKIITDIRQVFADMEIIFEGCRPSILDERYYTSEEICNIFHLSRRTLQNYRDDGTVPFSKIGEKILYREADIAGILEKNYVSVNDYKH